MRKCSQQEGGLDEDKKEEEHLTLCFGEGLKEITVPEAKLRKMKFFGAALSGNQHQNGRRRLCFALGHPCGGICVTGKTDRLSKFDINIVRSVLSSCVADVAKSPEKSSCVADVAKSPEKRPCGFLANRDLVPVLNYFCVPASLCTDIILAWFYFSFRDEQCCFLSLAEVFDIKLSVLLDDISDISCPSSETIADTSELAKLFREYCGPDHLKAEALDSLFAERELVIPYEKEKCDTSRLLKLAGGFLDEKLPANAVVAGGSVVYACCPKSKTYPGMDVDVFTFGPKASESAKALRARLRAAGFHIGYLGKDSVCVGVKDGRTVQIICTGFAEPDALITGFDMDYVEAYWSRRTGCMASLKAIRAWGTMRVHESRTIRTAPPRPKRLVKAHIKGFDISRFPMRSDAKGSAKENLLSCLNVASLEALDRSREARAIRYNTILKTTGIPRDYLEHLMETVLRCNRVGDMAVDLKPISHKGLSLYRKDSEHCIDISRRGSVDYLVPKATSPFWFRVSSRPFWCALLERHSREENHTSCR